MRSVEGQVAFDILEIHSVVDKGISVIHEEFHLCFSPKFWRRRVCCGMVSSRRVLPSSSFVDVEVCIEVAAMFTYTCRDFRASFLAAGTSTNNLPGSLRHTASSTSKRKGERNDTLCLKSSGAGPDEVMSTRTSSAASW